MTKAQAKKILNDLDVLKCSVQDTLEGCGAEDTTTYMKMFDAIYTKIEKAVGK